MRASQVIRRFVRSAFGTLGNHYLGVAALAALAASVWLWIQIAQDAPVILNIFRGWREAAIVACAGIAFGGLSAECVGLAARRPPGETPFCSTAIAAIFAMPLYAACILLSLA
jgi:hypothetical protein